MFLLGQCINGIDKHRVLHFEIKNVFAVSDTARMST